jgi:hypothetical protein
VQIVDTYAIGPANLSDDGTHPTQAGYDMMADIWFPALMTAIAESRQRVSGAGRSRTRTCCAGSFPRPAQDR